MADCGPECEQTLREIESFLDGELEVAVRIRVEHHLSGCNPCMERAEFRKQLKTLISEKCVESAVPGDVIERIRAALRDLESAE